MQVSFMLGQAKLPLSKYTLECTYWKLEFDNFVW